MEIEGYEKISSLGKEIFYRTHEAHKKILDDKSAWQVVRVKERKNYIETHFFERRMVSLQAHNQ